MDSGGRSGSGSSITGRPPVLRRSPPRNSCSGSQLLRRVYEIEPLVCPRCQGVMRVVAFITDGRVIRRILDHINASARRATQDRAPPPAAAALVAPVFP